MFLSRDIVSGVKEKAALEYRERERERDIFFESSISQTYMDFVKNEVGIGPMVTP